ncbi:MAG: hypothetical protein AMXMBFR53_35220 [Gemmatimonadota bacterium]
MYGIIAALAPAQAGGEGSLWQNIVESFPTDPASLFTLALAVGATILVIVAGRGTGGKGKGRGGVTP